MAVANGIRSVANARPTLCDMLPKELDTEIPTKPRRSISRAVSSVARRRPGSAIRLRAGKAAGIGGSFIPDVRADHSSCRPRALVRRFSASCSPRCSQRSCPLPTFAWFCPTYRFDCGTWSLSLFVRVHGRQRSGAPEASGKAGAEPRRPLRRSIPQFGYAIRAPIYTEGPGSDCLGFGRADDLRKHAPARHRLPLSVGRSTSKRIAIKECSPAELPDDPVVGLVPMSDGVDRQTLEVLLP